MSAAATPGAEAPGPSGAIVAFTFGADELAVVRLAGGDVGVTLRALCGAVGVDVDGQLNRLARVAATGARWATTSMMKAVGEDGRTRDMVVIPRTSIPMWAATVDVSRCAPEVRGKLVAYQDDAAEALARAFLPGAAPVAALPALASTPEAAIKVLVDAAVSAGRHGAAVALLNGYRALVKPQGKPGEQLALVDVGPGGRAKHGPAKLPMSVYAERVLAHVREHGPMSTRRMVDEVTGRDAALFGAIGGLIAAGALVRQRGEGGRAVYAVAASAEVH